jgi:integrase
MADAGCRLGEALAWDPTSLSPDGTLLRIYSTKVRRWRTVPATARLTAAIAACKRSRPRADAAITRRTLQRRLLELCQLAGSPPTTPHRLRHSYATRLHAEGVPLHTISQLLGHSSIITTVIYLHLGDTDYDTARKALDRRARRLAPRPRGAR